MMRTTTAIVVEERVDESKHHRERRLLRGRQCIWEVRSGNENTRQNMVRSTAHTHKLQKCAHTGNLLRLRRCKHPADAATRAPNWAKCCCCVEIDVDV